MASRSSNGYSRVQECDKQTSDTVATTILMLSACGKNLDQSAIRSNVFIESLCRRTSKTKPKTCLLSTFSIADCQVTAAP